jgi:hypothetical protein
MPLIIRLRGDPSPSIRIKCLEMCTYLLGAETLTGARYASHGAYDLELLVLVNQIVQAEFPSRASIQLKLSQITKFTPIDQTDNDICVVKLGRSLLKLLHDYFLSLMLNPPGKAVDFDHKVPKPSPCQKIEHSGNPHPAWKSTKTEPRHELAFRETSEAHNGSHRTSTLPNATQQQESEVNLTNDISFSIDEFKGDSSRFFNRLDEKIGRHISAADVNWRHTDRLSAQIEMKDGHHSPHGLPARQNNNHEKTDKIFGIIQREIDSTTVESLSNADSNEKLTPTDINTALKDISQEFEVRLRKSGIMEPRPADEMKTGSSLAKNDGYMLNDPLSELESRRFLEDAFRSIDLSPKRREEPSPIAADLKAADVATSDDFLRSLSDYGKPSAPLRASVCSTFSEAHVPISILDSTMHPANDGKSMLASIKSQQEHDVQREDVRTSSHTGLQRNSSSLIHQNLEMSDQSRDLQPTETFSIHINSDRVPTFELEASSIQHSQLPSTSGRQWVEPESGDPKITIEESNFMSDKLMFLGELGHHSGSSSGDHAASSWSNPSLENAIFTKAAKLEHPEIHTGAVSFVEHHSIPEDFSFSTSHDIIQLDKLSSTHEASDKAFSALTTPMASVQQASPPHSVNSRRSHCVGK